MILNFDCLLKLESIVEENIYETENEMENVFFYLKVGGVELERERNSSASFFLTKNIRLVKYRRNKKNKLNKKKILTICNPLIRKRKKQRKKTNVCRKDFSTVQKQTITKKRKKENNNDDLILRKVQRYIHNACEEHVIEVKSNKKRKCKHFIKLIREINIKEKTTVLSLAQSPDMNYIIAGLYNGTLGIYDFSVLPMKDNNKSTEIPEKFLMIHKGAITNVQFSPRKTNTFFTVGIDKKLKLWKLKKTRDITSLNMKERKKCIIKKSTNTSDTIILQLLCDIKFNYHITNCIFHSILDDVLIVGFINGSVKIIKVKKIYKEDCNSVLQETVAFRDTRKIKDGLLDPADVLSTMNHPIYSNACALSPYCPKKKPVVSSNRFLDPSNLCFPSNRNMINSNISYHSNHGMGRSGQFNRDISLLLESNSSNINNGNCMKRKGSPHVTMIKNFFETNFLENIDNLKKKKKRTYFFMVVKELKTRFSICSLGMPLCKKMLFVGLCNGVVKIYSSNYKLKNELLCKKRNGAFCQGKQVCSIKFNEKHHLVIITTLDNRISIYDLNKLCLIYKLKGHSNSSLCFETNIFLYIIEEKKYKHDENRKTRDMEHFKSKNTICSNNSLYKIHFESNDKKIKRGKKITELNDYKKEESAKHFLKIIAPSANGKIYIWDIRIHKYEKKKNSIKQLKLNKKHSTKFQKFLKLHLTKKKNNRRKSTLLHGNQVMEAILHDKLQTNSKEENNIKKVEEKKTGIFNNLHNENVFSNLQSKRIKEKYTSNFKDAIIPGDQGSEFLDNDFEKIKLKTTANKSNTKNFFQNMRTGIFKTPLFLHLKEKKKKEKNIYVSGKGVVHADNIHFSSKRVLEHCRKSTEIKEKKKINKNNNKIKCIDDLEYFVSNEDKKLSAICFSNQFLYSSNFCDPTKKKEEINDNLKKNFVQKIKSALEKKNQENKKTKVNKIKKFAIIKKKALLHSSSKRNSRCSSPRSMSVFSRSIKENNKKAVKTETGDIKNATNMSLQKYFFIITANHTCIKVFMCTENR